MGDCQHNWRWIDLEAQRCIRCGMNAEDCITELEREIAQARARIDTLEELSDAAHERALQAAMESTATATDLMRVKRENAAYRAIVKRVLSGSWYEDTNEGNVWCMGCGVQLDSLHGAFTSEHRAECVVTRARALLAGSPSPELPTD